MLVIHQLTLQIHSLPSSAHSDLYGMHCLSYFASLALEGRYVDKKEVGVFIPPTLSANYFSSALWPQLLSGSPSPVL